MTICTVGLDRNGNKVCRVKTENGRGFSIQTLGNMEWTHAHGIGPWTRREALAYVRAYGTKRQRELLGIK